MNEAAVQMRYREFSRRTGRTESADSVREFLHLEILRILSAQNLRTLILHGGCKTRYIDGSPRYSMDMDFSASPPPINNFWKMSRPDVFAHDVVVPMCSLAVPRPMSVLC